MKYSYFITCMFIFVFCHHDNRDNRDGLAGSLNANVDETLDAGHLLGHDLVHAPSLGIDDRLARGYGLLDQWQGQPNRQSQT